MSDSVDDNMSTRVPLTIIVAAAPNLGIGLKGSLPWYIKQDMQYFARVTSHIPQSSSSTPSSSAAQKRMNAVIMGRKTWDSIPPKFRPLRNRVNIVISRNAPIEAMATARMGTEWEVGPVWVDSVQSAVDVLQSSRTLSNDTQESSTSIPPIERGFVIGGAQIYAAFSEDEKLEQMVDSVLLTKVYGEWDVDTYLPVDYEKDGKWTRASQDELRQFAGEIDLKDGSQKDGDVEFEFTMYKKKS